MLCPDSSEDQPGITRLRAGSVVRRGSEARCHHGCRGEGKGDGHRGLGGGWAVSEKC